MPFKFSAGKCNAGDCGCGECTGSVCAAVVGPCLAADRAGVTLTVKDHATGIVAGTATTDSTGAACVSGLTPGSYDVTLAKTDCFVDPAESLNQTVTCSTLSIAAKVSCLPYGARKYTVLGCFGTPLPDAVVTVTGPVTTESVQTGSDGVAYYHYGATGNYTAVVSHPSGRFADSSPDAFTVANVCDSSAASVQLTPSSAYQCCDVQKMAAPPSPYPLKKVLKLTDQGGATSFTADAGCGGTACTTRLMDNAATCGGVSCGSIYCPGSGGAFYAALPPIGSQTCALFYKLTLSATAASLQQATPDTLNLDTGYQKFKTPQDPNAVNGCVPDTWRLWRVASDCSYSGSTPYRNSTGFTINSLYPLNITFAFDPGTGWTAPAADPMPSGAPYATTVVLSE